MQALWGEPWTARSVFVDENEVVPFRGDVTDLWLLAKQCTVTQWRQGPVERRRNGGVAQGSNSSGIRFDAEDSIPPIVVFSVLSCTFSEHCRMKSVDQRPPKVESGISDANRRFLCVKELRKGKERTECLSKKSRSICLSTKGSWTPDAVGEECWTKQGWKKPGILDIVRIKAKFEGSSPYGISLGFGVDSKPQVAKRSGPRHSYIYNISVNWT